MDINQVNKQVKLKSGNVLLTRKGTFGIATTVKEDLDYIISSEIFKIDLKENINPDFIVIVLNSSVCQRQFDRKKIGAIMGSLSQNAIKSIKIPFPPSDVQDKIISIIQNAYALKKQKENEAKTLLNSINDFVLNILEINLPEFDEKMCYPVYFNELDGRIDSHYHQPALKYIESTIEKINHTTLGDIIHFSNEIWNQENMFETHFPYIEIGQIDINFGNVKNVTYYEKKDAPSRAKMIVREGDIIISTTHPHRGAIAQIDKSLNGFIASTGFAVLRELKTSEIEKDYLFYIVRTNLCLNQMLKRSSGGNYRAITPEELKQIKIPLPEKNIQPKIVNDVKTRILRAELLQKEAQQILEKAKSEVEDILLRDTVTICSF